MTAFFHRPRADGPSAAPAADAGSPPVARPRTKLDAGATIRLSLAEKVLGMWLANRHQTLFPLTVNLQRVPPDHARAIAAMLAVTVLACPDPDHPATAAGRVAGWYRSAGADDGFEAVYRACLSDPPALSSLLDLICREGLETTAFAVSLAGANPRLPTSRPFLEYLSLRLRIPGDVFRSLAQRYRH